jgi:hypothetical protein
MVFRPDSTFTWRRKDSVRTTIAHKGLENLQWLLSKELGGGRLSGQGPAFDEACRIWNGAVPHRPVLVGRCANADHVDSLLRTGAARGLPISVRGGGHDWAGRALREGGLVIDLSDMREVSIDAGARVATIQGGARCSDVVEAAGRLGLAPVTGHMGSMGMAGLTLGGGYGPLLGAHGMALDNLLSAEVMLADGRRVTASATSEPELFWALRGGGGNFGVVTSLRVRLHPVSQVLAGFILFPVEEAAAVWTRLRPLLEDAPDALTVQTGIVPGPDGRPVFIVSPCWCGDLEQGQRLIERLAALGTPLANQVSVMSCADMLKLFDGLTPFGRHYALRTRSVRTVTPEVISALVAAGETRSSALSSLRVHHFHGAAARVSREDTAFANREPHLMIEVAAAWEPDGSDALRHLEWADRVSRDLEPSSLAGGYVNLLGPGERERAEAAYGAGVERLLALKARYDPRGVFDATTLPRRPLGVGHRN